ncbi:MAG TPA: flagellar basal-body MS-ring/collar protein FliF [Candidatus Eisenbacteria bacterium]|nr:flagellar basal-body MS-ring/collar protein FliF [Candidatus Eisenbacteria bacterium]
MNARLQQLWANLQAFFSSQPPARRIAIVAVGVGSMALVLGVAWWVQRPLYRPLFTNLSPEDASAIVETLRAEKVAYELDDGGHAILVPADRLYELRLSLASRGLPEGGGVGFEIFDKQSLGQTDFLQHLNYQRALQGELGRTIAQLGGVEAARVHLAIPERSLFVSQDRRPSASVVVKLLPGRALSRAQIDGIVHLIASSVQGMAPDAVTVVDEAGRMLTPEHRGDDATTASGTAIEYQRGIERATEERIESMLGTVVGSGKVIARVAATVDFSRTERTEESYDPDKTAVRQQHLTREETTGGKLAQGAPGTASNLTNDPYAASAEDTGPRTERRDETQSYEVSKTVSRTVGPIGTVKQLSVAVLVDGTYKEENGQRVFVPRSDEELDKLKTLVASAVGLSDARGDRIEVTSAAFQAPDLTAGEGILSTAAEWAPSLIARGLGIALVLGVLIFGVRPLVQNLGTSRALPRLGGLFLDREAAVSEIARENVALSQQNPERAAQLVRQWLVEHGQRTA